MGACGNTKAKQPITTKKTSITKTQEMVAETRIGDTRGDIRPTGGVSKKSIPMLPKDIDIKIVLDADNVLHSGKFNSNFTLLEVLASIATKLPRNAEFFVIDEGGNDITSQKSARLCELVGDKDRYIITMKYLGLDLPKDVRKAYQKINLIGAPRYETDPFEIIYYDKRTNKADLHTLADCEELKEFSYFSSHCNGNDRLYISGGEKVTTGDHKPPISNFVSVDLANGQVKRLKNLLTPRYWHSSIYIPNKFVFIVGGANEKSVELYDIDNDEITKDSMLFEERSEPSLCCVDNAFLYAFCGFKFKINYITSIERCNLQVKERTWELINYRPSGSVITVNFFATAYHQDNILFLGGTAVNNNARDRNLLYNPQTNSIESSTFSPINDVFQEKFFIPLADNLSALIPVADSSKVLLLKDDKLECLSIL
jgi:hypothetical protein